MKFKNLIKVFSLVFALGLFINVKIDAIDLVIDGYESINRNANLVSKLPDGRTESFKDVYEKKIKSLINNLNYLIKFINDFVSEHKKDFYNDDSCNDRDLIAVDKIVKCLNRNIRRSVQLITISDLYDIDVIKKLGISYAELAPKIFVKARINKKKWGLSSLSEEQTKCIFFRTRNSFSTLDSLKWEKDSQTFLSPPPAQYSALIPAINAAKAGIRVSDRNPIANMSYAPQINVTNIEFYRIQNQRLTLIRNMFFEVLSLYNNIRKNLNRPIECQKFSMIYMNTFTLYQGIEQQGYDEEKKERLENLISLFFEEFYSQTFDSNEEEFRMNENALKQCINLFNGNLCVQNMLKIELLKHEIDKLLENPEGETLTIKESLMSEVHKVYANILNA